MVLIARDHESLLTKFNAVNMQGETNMTKSKINRSGILVKQEVKTKTPFKRKPVHEKRVKIEIPQPWSGPSLEDEDLNKQDQSIKTMLIALV